jgi:hypothetical protein|tara:strand:+ start:2072 stop:2404 length:333 start_codon:yes stop_codon:yes gene_type:complete
MSKEMMVLASLYQLKSGPEGFSLGGETLLHENILVERKHVKRINDSMSMGGKYYKTDEEGTDKLYAEGAIKNAEKAEANEAKETLVEVLGDVIKEGSKARKSKKKKKSEE